MSRLLVLWPRTPGWHWLIADDTDLTNASVGGGAKPPAHRAEQVLLLLPAEEITLAAVELPQLSRARLRQALPYALEELVATDVDHLHIAAGPRLSDGKLAVAAVHKDRLQDYLDELAEYGIEVNIAMPDALCLPWTEKTLSLAACPGGWLYRHGEHLAGYVEEENLDTMLDLLDAAHLPTHIYGRKQPLHALAHYEHHAGQGTLAALSTAGARPNWQLLQNIKGSASQRQLSGLWRWTGAMGMLLLLVMLSYSILDWWLLKQAALEERQRIDMVFRRTFPNITTVVDHKLQAERELAARMGGADLFLNQLATAAPLLAASETLQLQGLDFDGDNLLLRIKAPLVADVDELSQRFTEAGLNARVMTATLGAGGVDGTIRITGYGS